MYNSKRQTLEESDPTATATHQFIDKIIESLNNKQSELKQFDRTLNGLSDTPHKSNLTL
jgi:hypothetical protein